MFGTKMQGALRRALYFIGESDYRNEYFECIIDEYLAQLNNNDSSKERQKKLAGLYLASQMVAQYAVEAGIYKIGIMVSEYLLIRYWRYLFEHNCFGKAQYGERLLKFLIAYEKWNHKYYEIIRHCCEGKERFPFYNSVEQRVLLYEVLGYLISYAYYLSFYYEYDQIAKSKCLQVHESIKQLIENNSQVFYAPYDRHVGIVSMLYRFLERIGRTEDISTLLQHQCMCLVT